jgi:hypothetical protein
MKLKQKKRKPTSGLIKVNGKLIHSATGRDAVEQCTDNSTSRGPTFDAALPACITREARTHGSMPTAAQFRFSGPALRRKIHQKQARTAVDVLKRAALKANSRFLLFISPGDQDDGTNSGEVHCSFGLQLLAVQLDLLQAAQAALQMSDVQVRHEKARLGDHTKPFSSLPAQLRSTLVVEGLDKLIYNRRKRFPFDSSATEPVVSAPTAVRTVTNNGGSADAAMHSLDGNLSSSSEESDMDPEPEVLSTVSRNATGAAQLVSEQCSWWPSELAWQHPKHMSIDEQTAAFDAIVRETSPGGQVQVEWLEEVSYAMHHAIEARVHAASAVKHARQAQIHAAAAALGPSACIVAEVASGDP